MNSNLLKLNAGSLNYVLNRKYEIYVSTNYMDVTYGQKIRINILNVNMLPAVLIA